MTALRSKLVPILAIALVGLSAAGLRLSEAPEETNFEVINGVFGKPVSVNNGEVTVSQVKVGTALKQFGEIKDRTDGIFVAITMTGAATGPNPWSWQLLGCSAGTSGTRVISSALASRRNPASRPPSTAFSRLILLRWTISSSSWGRMRSSTDTSNAYRSSSRCDLPALNSGARPPEVSWNPQRAQPGRSHECPPVAAHSLRGRGVRRSTDLSDLVGDLRRHSLRAALSPAASRCNW
jgi:hypothetical protein